MTSGLMNQKQFENQSKARRKQEKVYKLTKSNNTGFNKQKKNVKGLY